MRRQIHRINSAGAYNYNLLRFLCYICVYGLVMCQVKPMKRQKLPCSNSGTG